MSPHRLRPRFRLHLELTPAEALAQLQAALKQDCPYVGMVAELQMHFDLRLPPGQRKLWSPTLSGNFEPAETGCVLHGLIGPNPSAWTAIAFSYLALATGILFLLTLGGVQVFLDSTPWAFLATLGLLVLVLLTWLLSQLGQRLARPQTIALRHFLEQVFSLPPEEQQRTEADPYHR